MSILIAFAGLGAHSQTYFNVDFNSGTLPAGWTTTGNYGFGNTCLAENGNENYMWMALGGNPLSPASFQSPSMDFSQSVGVKVIFTFKYPPQGGSQTCEGPDMNAEGLQLQYSINDGATWSTFRHLHPAGIDSETYLNYPLTGGGITPFLNWTTIYAQLPAAGLTNNTKLRFYQAQSSGVNFDFWALSGIFAMQNVSHEEYNENGLSVSVFPNPTNEGATVSILNQTEKLQIQIYSMDGKLLHSDYVNDGDRILHSDIFGAGWYIIRFPETDLKPQKILKF